MPIQFLCPLCANPLQLPTQTNASYHCENKHCFDIAKEGYLNLLPVQHKKSKQPGDNADMIQARHRFLSAGYYDGAIETIGRETSKHLKDKEALRLLDIGCGEGYYLKSIAQQLKALDFDIPEYAGIDISKPAIKRAAKLHKALNIQQHTQAMHSKAKYIKSESAFAVCNAFNLPLASNSFDLALSVFSPIKLEEAARILKPTGLLVLVGPRPSHLQSLANQVYENAIPHQGHGINTDSLSEFTTIAKLSHEQSLIIEQAHILDLLKMTPYYWSCKQEKQQALAELKHLQTELAFDIHILQRV